MLVEEWMTKNVLTVTPDTSMMKAARLMKERSIRRLPVVDDEGKLVGIISDRDIKSASPSKATTLDMHEMYYLLSEMKIKDIMTRHPICAKPDDSIEQVAIVMTEKRFGGVPVVDDDRKVCGIITDSDIFKMFIVTTGVKNGGIQLVFDLPNVSGQLRPILDEFRAQDIGVASILTHEQPDDLEIRRVYIRLRPLSFDQERAIVEYMEERFPLIYWEEACKTC